MIIKQLLAGDLNVISVILLLFGAILFGFIKKLKSLFSHNKKKMLIYLLLTLLAYAITGLFTIDGVIAQPLIANYLSVQIAFLGFGILHIWALERFFDWQEDNKVGAQIALSLVCGLVGSIGFIQVAGRIGIQELKLFFWSGIILFFFPILFRSLFYAAMRIPIAIYQKWHYPVDRHFSAPDRNELRNPFLVSIEIEKEAFSGVVSRLRVKAPENMSFGNFFYHFLNDYNRKHPESPIEFLDDAKAPYGWTFHIKPRFVGKWAQVNYEQTISFNKIKENRIVLCERVKENTEVALSASNAN